jgi:hypothetical protein
VVVTWKTKIPARRQAFYIEATRTRETRSEDDYVDERVVEGDGKRTSYRVVFKSRRIRYIRFSADRRDARTNFRSILLLVR